MRDFWAYIFEFLTALGFVSLVIVGGITLFIVIIMAITVLYATGFGWIGLVALLVMAAALTFWSALKTKVSRWKYGRRTNG